MKISYNKLPHLLILGIIVTSLQVNKAIANDPLDACYIPDAEISVTINYGYIKPDKIEVEPSQCLRLSILTDEPGNHTLVFSGGGKEFTFFVYGEISYSQFLTLDTPGVIQVYCNIQGHREAGEEAQIVVNYYAPQEPVENLEQLPPAQSPVYSPIDTRTTLVAFMVLVVPLLYLLIMRK